MPGTMAFMWVRRSQDEIDSDRRCAARRVRIKTWLFPIGLTFLTVTIMLVRDMTYGSQNGGRNPGPVYPPLTFSDALNLAIPRFIIMLAVLLSVSLFVRRRSAGDRTLLCPACDSVEPGGADMISRSCACGGTFEPMDNFEWRESAKNADVEAEPVR